MNNTTATSAAAPASPLSVPANEAKEYSFDGETMICNGRAYAVEYAISRSASSRIPTVTAFCWVTMQGQRRRLAIRFQRGSRHHAAALAAAQEAVARYQAGRVN